jgi:hypothetical protein
MKKIYSLLSILLFLSIAFDANAQNDDGISQLFKGTPDDVNKLVNAYSNPLFKGFGNSLNGGWTNTAKTLGLLHFVVRVTASTSFVPDADKTYNVNSLNLANIKATGSPIAPTFGGDKDLSTGIMVSDPSDPNNPSKKYLTTLPKGVIGYIPAPQVQLTVGLIKNTDVTLRLIPTINITDDVGKLGMFGIGFKHNFANDLGPKALPFDLALAIGYTRLNYNKTLNVRPDADGVPPTNQDYGNQHIEGHFNGWNTQVILSKKLLFFTPFVSVGYLTSSTNVGMKGNFPFVTSVNAAGKPVYTTYTDPINISGSSASISGARADIGFQLSLAFFKLYGSYSFAEYQSVNAGIGLGF